VKDRASATEELSKAARESKNSKYVLKLYVAGVTRKSSAAIRSITAICEEYLKNRYSLEIIDIYKNPTLAKGEQIIAAPTLLKLLPEPLRRLIGDMADKEKVLVGLDLRTRDEKEPAKPQKDRQAG
jgi:circadian clock protein KaiB